MVEFSHFHKEVEMLLGHSVWTHEFSRDNAENLRREALEAIKRLE